MTKAAELAKIGEVATNGQIGGRRNAIINGGFTISQRNGTTSTLSANNNFTLDRWNYYLGGSVRNKTQQLVSDNAAVVALNTASGQTFNNALLADCTTAAAASNDDLVGYIQVIEGSNSVPLAGQVSTLSFYVQSSVAGQYYVALKIGSARSYIASYTVNSADTWERKEISLIMDTLAELEDGGSILDNAGFQVHFTLRATTSSQLTNNINQWVDGNFYAKSDQVSWGTNTNQNWYLAGVQLELGSKATPFEHKLIGEEENLCKRYFIKHKAAAPFERFALGTNVTTDDAAFLFKFYPAMRGIPTLTIGTLSHLCVTDADGSNEAIGTAPVIDAAADSNLGVIVYCADITNDTLTAGDASFLAAADNVNAFLAFDAEIPE